MEKIRSNRHIVNIFNQYDYHKNVTLRNNRFAFTVYQKHKKAQRYNIIGMIRLRNEELILRDTLDHMSQFVDGIVIFDDASTDSSVEIARAHDAVIEVIVNNKWRKNERAWEETANRSYLYNRAKKYAPEWFFYADADERFEGGIKKYLIKDVPRTVNAIKISLFDAYITSNDKKPYYSTDKLYNFRSKFGLERRDIVMIWRNIPTIRFKKQDLREPQGVTGDIITKFYCQHYGKSLSIEHWEETCRYYAENFPKYSEKWKQRFGKAVHAESDFNTPLKDWSAVKKEGFKIN